MSELASNSRTTHWRSSTAVCWVGVSQLTAIPKGPGLGVILWLDLPGISSIQWSCPPIEGITLSFSAKF